MIKQMYDGTKEMVEVGRYFGEDASRLPAEIVAATIVLRELIAMVVCRFAGHKMVDDSTAGPDTGCVAGHCERCSFSFHQTLY